MNKRQFKNSVYNELARITKALANPHRLEIVELLAQGEFSVEQIAEQTGLPMANASQHLQVLKAGLLVDVTRQGNHILYRLANDNVFRAWSALRALGMERIGAIEKVVRQFRQNRLSAEAVTIDQLVEKVRHGKATVLDVRPETEYKQGHIKNAISIPWDQLAKRLKELPKRKEVVAYCRGPFCVYADDAVALLRKEGFKAFRLDEGFPDWKVRQLPVSIDLN
jgi:rhodanese-related sulfurtransferase